MGVKCFLSCAKLWYLSTLLEKKWSVNSFLKAVGKQHVLFSHNKAVEWTDPRIIPLVRKQEAAWHHVTSERYELDLPLSHCTLYFVVLFNF